MNIELPRINDPRGNLSFIEGGAALPFEIERCYWIYDVPGGRVRHGRALRRATELVVALSGSFDVITDDGHGNVTTTHLCRSYQGVVIEPMHWRQIVNFSTNSVAMVLASTTYDETDYIRDYEQFVAAVASGADITPQEPRQASVAATEPADSHANSSIDDCRVIDLPRHADPNGNLTEVENTAAYPFALQRVFYLYDVPANSVRGGHSHHQAHELIVAVSGAFKVTIDDGRGRRTVTLDRPYQALYISPGIWRTLEDFSGGSVCMVLTSEKYSEADYVRDYAEFKRLTAKEPTPADQPSKPASALKWKYPFLSLATVNTPYAADIKDAVNRVIDSGYYIGGPEVEAFERAMLPVAETPYCVGVSNGLDALRLILRGYMEMGRLREGDEVIVPADTYVASVLAITDNRLRPVLVDADWRTMNLDTSKIAAAITWRTRAIMPVHLYGLTCWDDCLVDIAADHHLIVVEDNAQAIGSQSVVAGLYGTHRTGGLGDAGAFSFYPTKNIGALGDAGAVCTHDEELAHVARALRNYGTDRQYHNIYAGLNCRLDPMQAAILSAKLPHLEKESALRRRNAQIYTESIYNPNIVKPLWPDEPLECVWHQYVVRVADRDRFRRFLSDHGVETAVHYPAPPHRQPCYADLADAEMPVAELIDSQVVSLPISSCTSADDARQIAAIINGYTG